MFSAWGESICKSLLFCIWQEVLINMKLSELKMKMMWIVKFQDYPCCHRRWLFIVNCKIDHHWIQCSMELCNECNCLLRYLSSVWQGQVCGVRGRGAQLVTQGSVTTVTFVVICHLWRQKIHNCIILGISDSAIPAWSKLVHIFCSASYWFLPWLVGYLTANLSTVATQSFQLSISGLNYQPLVVGGGGVGGRSE